MIINCFGGKCQLCGYSKCLAVLSFHHRDSKLKKFNISKTYHKSRMTYELALELSKCVLLCANCHFEVHQGVSNIDAILPIDYEIFLCDD